jgi:hypothetical protein
LTTRPSSYYLCPLQAAARIEVSDGRLLVITAGYGVSCHKLLSSGGDLGAFTFAGAAALEPQFEIDLDPARPRLLAGASDASAPATAQTCAVMPGGLQPQHNPLQAVDVHVCRFA